MIRWLDNNPVGQILAMGCGVLVLASASLAYVWTRPATSGLPHHEANGEFETSTQAQASDIGPISDYREVTERPVFDPTRQPAVALEGEGLEEDGEIADAPEVKLTGVVITPDSKFVTLKPASGKDSLIAREGQSLEGDYYGWTVAGINPRSVALESRDGESLELELEVNTRKMAEPPRPEPRSAAEAGEGEEGASEASGAPVTDGEEPMSRAEEIRQRIAERREELRRQAREEEESGGSPRSTSAYQSAIRNMINRSKRNEKDDENDSENGKDG